MADLPESVITALAGPVAEALPVIVSRIPPGPAADLGRTAVPAQDRPRSRRVGYGVRARPARHPGLPPDPPVIEALGEAGPLLAERLLGALELTIGELGLAGAAGVPLGEPPTGRFASVAFVHNGGESQAEAATALLEQFHPGALDLAASLTRRLTGHELVAPLLAVASDVTGEMPIAAAHGTGYLALAVATASAVIGDSQLPLTDSPAAAVVGVALGVALLLLREAPMPAGYAAALLEQTRAEYLLPVRGGVLASVSGHRFALAEGQVPDTADFSGNGLVAVVPGGAVIRTGVGEGSVGARLSVLADEPPVEETGWDEIVEVSWRADAGQARLNPQFSDLDVPATTPPWPGDYRLRVHATGRDDAGDDERYELLVWQAPEAPEIVHKRTDQLGYRLRGERAPARRERPERAYHWVEDSSLSIAATVTVVSGASVPDVLTAFGADPARPESLTDLDGQQPDTEWVAVLDVADAVLAVEYNGFRGSDEDVLRRLSASGRAASMYWNVNALSRLSFAQDGEVLAAFEPGIEPSDEAQAVPAVAAALRGLDFDDYRDKTGKGLVAVQRFTGRGITAQDLERIEAADIAFRIASG